MCGVPPAVFLEVLDLAAGALAVVVMFGALWSLPVIAVRLDLVVVGSLPVELAASASLVFWPSTVVTGIFAVVA
jgi:hypothetical protein